jgi:hypothetical protein
MGELPIEEIRGLIRLWRSNLSGDSDWGNGYDQGLVDAADDLETLLKKDGHIA